MSILTNGNGTILDSILATTSTADTCNVIDICRTRYTIVWSSLVTILACVWTAVHRNVPAPKRDGELQFWRIVGGVLGTVRIVVVTVLVPEWVLAWAVRQFLSARDVGHELEEARGEAKKKWEAKQETLKGMTPSRHGEGLVTGEQPQTTANATSAEADSSGEKLEGRQVAYDDSTVAVNENTGRMRGKWTARHGFAVVMGGFHYYALGEPKHPLSRDDIVKLVASGEVVPPTDEEIRNWSQSDVLSKTLAVVQTLWFIVQAIARHIEGLSITQLEIMTLAYTVITVAMYVAWWDKPQSVGGPVRIAVKKLPEPNQVDKVEWYEHIYNVVSGGQDRFVDLRKERRVPTFYGGSTDDGNGISADLVALVAAMAFGAVHCAAWHYDFPSDAEKLIWRVSSLAIVALPAAIFALIPLLVIIASTSPNSTLELVFVVIFALVFAVSAPLYIAARSLLLALSFSTLRSLPPEAYRAVQWTLRIPHFT
ncbi:hypothetical protein BV25DRAFT_1918212 [Artomyces pyxidatus]|uniref:Uncharacterized protein n=1 Tax=Artomyces pyxidatus TaxID=48021 RepID=A0ACB8SUI2_9AGAM|nr:hypothetical protein BV25DRAFT_1918212 [Artomyces pyxidatus]